MNNKLSKLITPLYVVAFPVLLYFSFYENREAVQNFFVVYSWFNFIILTISCLILVGVYILLMIKIEDAVELFSSDLNEKGKKHAEDIISALDSINKPKSYFYRYYVNGMYVLSSAIAIYYGFIVTGIVLLLTLFVSLIMYAIIKNMLTTVQNIYDEIGSINEGLDNINDELKNVLNKYKN